MFEKYSIKDLFANIFKNKFKNIILGVVIILMVLIPFVLKAAGKTYVVSGDTLNYSTYIVYDIDSGNDVVANGSNNMSLMEVEPYTTIFSEIIKGNANGAYLLGNEDEDTIAEISAQLSIDKVQLINSDSNFWLGKILVVPTPESGNVGVQILTASKKFNDIAEAKFDALVKENADNLPEVSAEKISSIHSIGDNQQGEDVIVKGSVGLNTVVKGGLLGVLFAIFMILAVNFVAYIFNPTMNDDDAFKELDLDFIYNFDSSQNCADVVKYKEQTGRVTLVAYNKKVYEKFKNEFKKDGVKLPAKLVVTDNVQELINAENIIFVEEYGITRYGKFEKELQQAKNLNKNVIGTINLAL